MSQTNGPKQFSLVQWFYLLLVLFAGTYNCMYLTVLEMLITDSQIFELDIKEHKKSMTQIYIGSRKTHILFNHNNTCTLKKLVCN